jgi:hypothetical protein
MKLIWEQSRKLLQERDVWLTEACDRCGQLLGSVRWTRKSEPGDWCSKGCRDGVAAVQKRKAQRVGRPRLVLSEKARASRRRTQVREAVARHRLNVIKNHLQRTESKEVGGALFDSGYPPTSPQSEAL